MAQPIRVLELRSVRGTGGGPEKTILRGAAQADPSRFAVTVCYLRDERDQAFAMEPVARAHGVADYVEVLERHSFDLGIWPRLRRLVADRQIDIVHAHDYKTDLLALALAWSDGVVPLSTAHGWIRVSWRERFLYYPADLLALRRFPRVVAVSTPLRATLVERGVPAARVTTILNGIDATAFRRCHELVAPARAALGLPASAVVVGAVGRLQREKRYDVLIEAIAHLRRSGLDVRVVLVGDGAEREALRGRADGLGLADACLFTGRRTDVIEIAHGFDVMAQSSDTEGTSNAVLEAMALEIPVVATAVGGTPDLITHRVHGRLVPRRAPEALAAALEETVRDSADTATFVRAARRRVEDELSFSARMQALERTYEELMDRRRADGPTVMTFVGEHACGKQ